MKHLAAKAWLSVVALGVVMGPLLFGTAGTIRYREAWGYLAICIGFTGDPPSTSARSLTLVRHD